MNNISWIKPTLVALTLLLAPAFASAQPYPVSFGMESLMQTFFGETGVVGFREYDAAFAPEGGMNAEVVLADAAGTILARHPFFDSYRFTSQVFARVAVVGPAEVQLSAPGVYNIFLLVDGEIATRMPFVVNEASDGSDPFAPLKTYSYDGFWRQLGYMTEPRETGFQGPLFNFWVGGPDLAEPSTGEGFRAALYGGDEVLFHSKRASHGIAPGHFARTDLVLFHPHAEREEANAPLFTMADLAALDGAYVLRIFRESDDALIRAFHLTVEGGKLQQHARARLGFQPPMDFILPRVVKRGSNVYEMVEAFWFESR